MSKLYATLSLLLLLSSCSAAKLKPRESKDEDGVDRYSHIQIPTRPAFLACGAMTAAATAMHPGDLRQASSGGNAKNAKIAARAHCTETQKTAPEH